MKNHLRSVRPLLLALAVVVSATCLARAEPDVVKVEPDHYRGTWLEIARRPMYLTDGCVAGYSSYRQGPSPSEILVEDGCRVDTPKGRLKTVKGIGTITDYETTNAKMRVRLPIMLPRLATFSAISTSFPSRVLCTGKSNPFGLNGVGKSTVMQSMPNILMPFFTIHSAASTDK